MNCFVFRICKSDFRMFKERISCPEAALTAPFPGYRLADCGNAAASLHRHLHRFSQLHHHRFMFLGRRQGAVDPDAVAILARCRKQRARRDSIFSRHSCLATQTISTCSGSSTHSIKPPFGRVTQIPQGKNSRSQQV